MYKVQETQLLMMLTNEIIIYIFSFAYQAWFAIMPLVAFGLIVYYPFPLSFSSL